MTVRTETRFQNEAADRGVGEDGSVQSRKPYPGNAMQWCCPNCGSTDLKRVSLVYEQGLSHTIAKSCWSGFVLGDIAIGRTVTHANHESELSVRLRPPVKWSYAKLFLYAGLVTIVSLIVCVHVVMGSASAVSSFSITMGGAFGLSAFGVGLFAIWRRNHVVYPRQLAEWQEQFLCRRCGMANRATTAK